MTKRLVLLRHGQTDWNAARRMQGQRNSQLNETGLAQATSVASVIATFMPEVLWTSDLDRARRTAAIVGEACSRTPTTDERLREYSLGSLEGMTHDEFLATDPDGFAVFRAADWGALAEIEPPVDVAKRVVDCLGDLADGLTPNGVGVAVAHGAAIRTAVVALLGWPLSMAQELAPLGNCAWVGLTERGHNQWALDSYNRTLF